MCYPIRCSRCGKITWAGCGQHADSVMKSVPASQRCTCRNGTAEERIPAPHGSGGRRIALPRHRHHRYIQG
ncbi:MAG: hypothetical protein WBW75_24465 [Mycobacterium sp.]